MVGLGTANEKHIGAVQSKSKRTESSNNGRKNNERPANTANGARPKSGDTRLGEDYKSKIKKKKTIRNVHKRKEK